MKNELYHHGVKGQKWGVRNYQNEDGSLTPEGRIHYGYGNENTKLYSRFKNKTIKVIKQESNGSGGGSSEDEEANKLGDELIKKIEEFANKQKDNPNFNSNISSWLDPKAAKGSEGSIEWYLEEYLNIDSTKLNNSTIKKIETKFKNHFKSNLAHSLKIQGNELYHHGVKGQKWGVRNYQHEDGTYTEEGKERRRVNKGSNSSSVFKRAFTNNIKNGKDKPNTSPAGKIFNEIGNTSRSAENIVKRYSKNNKSSGIDKLTDQDLRNYINRKQLERQYNELRSSEITTGKETLSNILNTVGDIAAIGASAATIYSMIMQIKGE